MHLIRPETLSEAYSALEKGDWKILSGGTDFYPALGARPVDFDVLDVSRIGGMREIIQDNKGNWHIGCLATWTDIVKHDLPGAFDGLKLAAREVGSIQIQNRATIAGNICNASPAADGVPPLLTLDAIVKIGSTEGERQIPLSEFILGNRKTDLKPNELVTGIIIPCSVVAGNSNFKKLGSRKYLVISITMVAVRLVISGSGDIDSAAIAVGSCSAVAQRLSALERALTGKNVADDFHGLVTDSHFSELTPIDDVRATGEYRLAASKELVSRTLSGLAQDFFEEKS